MTSPILTSSLSQCRKVFDTTFKTKCSTAYKKVCEDFYETKTDWVYKEQCSTTYEKACYGYGYDKKCHDVPKESCKQVPVKVSKKVSGKSLQIVVQNRLCAIFC